jgi:Ca2+-binding RTX toxin-like protein
MSRSNLRRCRTLPVALLAAVLLVFACAAQAVAKETIVLESGLGLDLVSAGKLTEASPETPDGFGVSPDGEEVVLTPYFGEYNGAVLILDLGTKETEVISTPEESGMRWSEVRFSPSGEQVIGRAYSEETGAWSIYAMDTDGTKVRELVSYGAWPVMSSQGALAYLSSSEGHSDLYVVDPTPSGESVPRRLATSGYYGENSGRPSFSPDGEYILFPREKNRTYAISVATGKAKLLSTVGSASEWETATTVLDASGSLTRRDIETLKSTTLAETAGGWVRTNQPAGEAVPPEAFEPPSCAPRSVEMLVDQEEGVWLECDGPQLTYEIDSGPSHGEVVEFSAQQGFIGYKPEVGFLGADTITFHAINADGETKPMALSIGVHAAICESRQVGTEVETPLPVSLPCFGPWLPPESEEGEWEPEPLSYEIVTAPKHGEASGFNASTGELTYLPDAEFDGEDTLAFRATDSHGSSETATLSISVGGAPSCDDLTTHTEPGEPAHIDLACDRAVGEESSFEVVNAPSHGSIQGFEAGTGALRYQPEPLFAGQDTFTFRAENWAGESNEATATIDVCAKPTLEASGEAVDPEVPGVDLTVSATPGEPECEIDGALPEVTMFVVSIDDEVVYSEERQCGDAENPCGRADWEREIQLPLGETVGTHDIRVEAKDQFGNSAKPIEKSETTPAEGTVAQLPPEAEDSKGSKGCETPKNRYGRYVFKGKVVRGTPCADILVAYPKHHTEIYLGGGGDDVVRTGGEIDKIKGGAGDDRIYAGRGNDIVYGEGGDDQIVGGSGDDRLVGKSGSDNISGTSGSDLIRGDSGNDLIRGGTTADSLFGGSDTDVLSFADAVTPGFKFGEGFIEGFPANAEGRGIYLNLSEEAKKDNHGEYIRAFNGSTARFGGGVDKVYVADGGFENVIGSSFADVIEGSGGPNLIEGSGGTDILEGSGGSDVVYGGADSDLVDGGSEQVAGNLHGGAGDDICVGGAESKACERESTEEGLEAVAESVAIGRLDPEDPAEDSGIYVRGSGGTDAIVASWDEKGEQVNFTAKGVGFDPAANGVSGCTVEAALAHCPLTGIQTLVMDGANGNDVLKANHFAGSVSVTLLGGAGNDNLFGGPSEDILVDGPEGGKDDLYGLGDDDTLLANDGLDRLFGADGADLFVSASICEGDTIKGGGDARDNASWAQLRGKPKGETDEFDPPENGVSVSIPEGKSGDISRNGGKCEDEGHIQGVELLEGSGGPDRLEGNDEHNIILGRSGKDELLGLGSVDSLLANNHDPAASTKEEQEDADEALDCGSPSGKTGKDHLSGDPADSPAVENCERVNLHAPPTQARVSGIGGDPTAEAPTANSDEDVVGGMRDPDAIPPMAFFRLDEESGSTAENWADEEAPGEYEEGIELDQPGAIEDSRGVGLDGEDDYIDLTDNWDPSEVVEECGDEISGYSVEMWVKFDGEASGREELFSRSEGGEGVFLYRSTDGRLNFSMVDARESPRVATDEAIGAGDWHHVVATIARRLECPPSFARMSLSPEAELENSTRLTLSVDGFSYALGLDPSSAVPASISSSHNLVGARAEEGGPSNLLSGSVDDVAIYDTPIGEDEIEAHLLISEAPEPAAVLLPPVDPEDGDADEDGVLDSVDNCAEAANADQEDTDADGIGDSCQSEPDSDGDEVPDEADNCPEDTNALQEDADENGVGDACEPE